MTKLTGRVALVFGAGSAGPGWGNGKASAVAYARAGARVACVDISRTAAEETVGLIRAEGGTAEAFACDVTRLLEVEDVVAGTGRALGAVDILHNNVGHAKMGGPPDLSEEDWRREMDLNVTGMFLACKVVIPSMLERGRGVITNIGSAAGLRYTGYPYSSYYAAKGAVNQFTIGIALQYARAGLRCNAILPGIMDTPLIYQQISTAYASPEEMVQARHEASPTGRMGSAWDVAHTAVFLASEEASYINGVLLPVDGGLTARCG